ncbi:uncharacterized protein EV422DRAFT_263696 [Fimicolochytrium jonesii]|uniref:uncharacterized protein n=1 Tax=Fimicolochytrium jonesii TaxID=1396493 RepID=UPI0022FE7169|nr:uncharacterized protein EV422DRAFT_263696 [Fimicolochytrium jonesii]KAI8817062.1 hypothetical protein EV422DRAFT_263696 [Fimicolochytrium jonesii]
MATAGSIAKCKALPLELIPRILCLVALTDPKDLVNCLLVCKAWNASLSIRERCVVSYGWIDSTNELERFYLFDHGKGRELSVVDTQAYTLWDTDRIRLAFLTSEFALLQEMQADMWECAERSHPDAPEEDADWVALAHDLDLLAGPFSLYNTYGQMASEPRSLREVYEGSGTRDVGVEALPFLLAPVPELEGEEPTDDSAILETLLYRLWVSEDVKERYKLRRIELGDSATFRRYRNFSYLGADVHEDEEFESPETRQERRRKVDECFEALVDEDFVELIDVSIHREEDAEWSGTLPNFIVCRRREAGCNLLGWLVYWTTNDHPY